MSLDPASLQIVHYPAKVLRQKAKPVPAVTDEVRAVAERMIALMFEAEGIGLAAPQVGLAWRMFVVHVPAWEGSEDEPGRSPDDVPPTATAKPVVYINPTLSKPQGDLVPMSEGCLSLPDIRGPVRRPERITIAATDLDGKPFTQEGAGLLARCWQHEYDHLEGVLIIDKFPQMARLKNRDKIRQLERAE